MAHSIDPAAGAVRGFVPARNDEERYLMRHIEDLADAAFSRGIARYSAFLSDREQDLARAALGRAGVRDGWRFDGGRAFAPLAKYVYIFLAALVVFFSFIIPGGIG